MVFYDLLRAQKIGEKHFGENIRNSNPAQSALILQNAQVDETDEATASLQNRRGARFEKRFSCHRSKAAILEVWLPSRA